jgi:hypothetical protein
MTNSYGGPAAGAAEAARLLLSTRTNDALHLSGAPREEGEPVLYTLAVVLLILWLLGMVSGYTVGAFIHVLLVVALVLFLIQIISGRRPAL